MLGIKGSGHSMYVPNTVLQAEAEILAKNPRDRARAKGRKTVGSSGDTPNTMYDFAWKNAAKMTLPGAQGGATGAQSARGAGGAGGLGTVTTTPTPSATSRAAVMSPASTARCTRLRRCVDGHRMLMMSCTVGTNAVFGFLCGQWSLRDVHLPNAVLWNALRSLCC